MNDPYTSKSQGQKSTDVKDKSENKQTDMKDCINFLTNVVNNNDGAATNVKSSK